MSRKREITITCPACGKESPFIMWDSINTMINPEMKQAVRDRSAFKFECPHCRNVSYVDYSTLYHQMEDNLMIYYVQNPEDVSRTCDLFSGDIKFGSVDLQKEGYRLRVVRSLNELLEKLRIFDTGLDDRVIELLKVMILSMAMRNYPGAKSIQEAFFQEEGENFIGIWVDKEFLGKAPITSKAYEETALEFKAELQGTQTDTPLIDKHWAARFFDIAGDDRARVYLNS